MKVCKGLYKKSNKNSSNQWFSSLLCEAKDEARGKGNAKFARYIEELLPSNIEVVGGEAA